MTKRKSSQNAIHALLNDERLRRTHHEGRTYYSITDLIQTLVDTGFPAEYWVDLKKREPSLEGIEEVLEIEREGQVDVIPMAEVTGVFRLIQSIASPQAEKLKKWLAQSALEHLEELENPELAVLRMRRVYEEKGYSARWIDKRLRGVSARQELTSEWSRRGAAVSEEYRALTNALMEGVFGMDVEGLRRYKNLQRPTQNLRDYMSDLELVLTSLAETAAVTLGRHRASHGFEELVQDAQEAGRIAGEARTRIEQGSAHKARRVNEHALASGR
jgi:hypothetical protein